MGQTVKRVLTLREVKEKLREGDTVYLFYNDDFRIKVVALKDRFLIGLAGEGKPMAFSYETYGDWLIYREEKKEE